MTTLLNDNPHDPMFQVHVNLWHSTLQDSYKAATGEAPSLEAAISNADAAVKAFKKRFKVKAQPEPVPSLGTAESRAEAFPQHSDPAAGDEYPSPETSGTH